VSTRTDLPPLRRQDRPPSGQRARAEADPDRCAQCSAHLAEDQEWCLECGSSRTLIYTPPDWRLPLAAVSMVVALALAGFVFAIVRLSDHAGRAAAANAAAVTPAPRVHGARHGRPSATAGARTTTAATGATSGPTPTSTVGTTSTPGARTATGTTATAATPSASATNTTHSIATWPVGLSGWTVILAKYPTEAQAYVRARQIAPTGMPVGVLNSTDHPTMQPGLWIVFSRRYPDHTDARAEVMRLIAAGYTTARARQVAPPGGL
jgi:hypothetical protein